jgi:hypothetical protein
VLTTFLSVIINIFTLYNTITMNPMYRNSWAKIKIITQIAHVMKKRWRMWKGKDAERLWGGGGAVWGDFPGPIRLDLLSMKYWYDTGSGILPQQHTHVLLCRREMLLTRVWKKAKPLYCIHKEMNIFTSQKPSFLNLFTKFQFILVGYIWSFFVQTLEVGLSVY